MRVRGRAKPANSTDPVRTADQTGSSLRAKLVLPPDATNEIVAADTTDPLPVELHEGPGGASLADGSDPVLSARVLRRFLFWCIGALLVAHILVMFMKFGLGRTELLGLVDMLDMNQELNIPTLFSATLLMLCAVVLGVTANCARFAESSVAIWGWRALSLGFVVMAIDEFGALHEHLARPMREMLGDNPVFTMGWVFAAVPVLVLLLPFAILFLRAVPRRFARLFLLAGLIYIAGAVGVETFSGWYRVTLGGGGQSFGFSMISAVEETLEMAGPALMLSFLIEYLVVCRGVTAIRMSDSAMPRA